MGGASPAAFHGQQQGSLNATSGVPAATNGRGVGAGDVERALRSFQHRVLTSYLNPEARMRLMELFVEKPLYAVLWNELQKDEDKVAFNYRQR